MCLDGCLRVVQKRRCVFSSCRLGMHSSNTSASCVSGLICNDISCAGRDQCAKPRGRISDISGECPENIRARASRSVYICGFVYRASARASMSSFPNGCELCFWGTPRGTSIGDVRGSPPAAFKSTLSFYCINKKASAHITRT